MSSLFDFRTGVLVVGILYLIMPVATWVALQGQRTLQAKLWCAGGLGMAVYVVLVAFRGSLPDVLPFTVANFFAFAAMMMRIQSLRIDLGNPAKPWHMVMLTVAFIAVFEYLRLVVQNDQLRLGYVMAVGLILVGSLAWLPWRLGRKENCRGAYWLASAYGLLFVAWLVRLIYVASGLSSSYALENTGDTVFLLFVTLYTAIVGHIGYLGLMLERSQRREIISAAEQARVRENIRLSAHIAQLDRQRALGEMSASLGHELNQPLTAIMANAQTAERSLNSARFESTKVAELMGRIIFNSRRASQIIERIRGFIRPESRVSEPFDLIKVIHGVRELVSDQLQTASISFAVVSDRSEMIVTGDQTQISQIMLNVFRNAIEAVMTIENPKIHVELCRVDERFVVKVSDNGVGLDSIAITKAGSPFFSTKENGLGVGLSISRSIAEQHGGSLAISNGCQSGAVVEITLPVTPSLITTQVA